MHVVVQRMVDARAAGVVFTADPTSGRRDLVVIDAIAGLGEALVDGSAVSDHLVLTSDGAQAVREVGDVPVLSDDEVADIRAGATACRPALGQADGSGVGDRRGRAAVVAAGQTDHHAARGPQRDGHPGRRRHRTSTRDATSAR